MNYLITGGCGFVGSNIAAYLLENVRRRCPEAPVVYSSSNKVYGELAGVRLREEVSRYVAPDYPDGLDETIGLDSQTLLDWQPKVRREEGVRKVLAWLRTQPQSFPQSATAIRN